MITDQRIIIYRRYGTRRFRPKVRPDHLDDIENDWPCTCKKFIKKGEKLFGLVEYDSVWDSALLLTNQKRAPPNMLTIIRVLGRHTPDSPFKL